MNSILVNIIRKLYWKYLRIKLRCKDPIFIVGCGHSGTSLMLSILSYHPEIYGVLRETSIFLNKSINFSLFNKYFKEADKKRLLEKTPKHVTKINRILKVFPKAKIIIMLRDGRDVACSLKKRLGSFEKGVDRWISDNQEWIKYKTKEGKKEKVLVVKLEELINNKEIIMYDVFKFLEIRNYPEIFDYHTKKREFFKENSSEIEHIKLRNKQINSPIKDSSERWKQEMTEEEKEIFRIKGNKLLLKFGYEKNENW